MKFIKKLKARQLTTNPGLEENTPELLKFYIDYLNDVYKVLGEVAKNQRADWRIIRMHQPVFNVEYDYLGMKLNKKLMSKIKKAHIHVHFVSHYHNAQFSVSLFEQHGYTYKNLLPFNYKSICRNRQGGSLEGVTLNQACNPTSPWTSMDDFHPWSDASPPKFITEPHQTCSKVDRSEAVLKVHTEKGTPKQNKLLISNKNEEFILQVLTGHSGRTLDPPIGDKCSDMVLVYAQAESGLNGYTKAKFFKDGKINKLDITYYSLTKAGGMQANWNILIEQKKDKSGDTRKNIFKKLNEENFNSDILRVQLNSRVDSNGEDLEYKD